MLFVLAASGGAAAAGQQPARRRTPQGPAGRADPVGELRAADRRRRCSLPFCSACGWLRANACGASASTRCSRCAVTASVQLVGVYLVFASLIVPALATVGHAGRRRLVAAMRIGAPAMSAGWRCRRCFDLPSGAVIVWTLAGCALLAQAVPALRRSHPARAPALVGGSGLRWRAGARSWSRRRRSLQYNDESPIRAPRQGRRPRCSTASARPVRCCARSLRGAAGADRAAARRSASRLAGRRLRTRLRGVRQPAGPVHPHPRATAASAGAALVLLIPGWRHCGSGPYAPWHHAVVLHALIMTVGGTLVGLAHLSNLRLSHVHVHDAHCVH